MNPDLHMGGDLKSTSAGNLFIIFGEPDIKIEDGGDGLIRVKVFGVDVFKPQTGEIISEGTDGIALWMLDTDYNEEKFLRPPRLFPWCQRSVQGTENDAEGGD